MLTARYRVPKMHQAETVSGDKTLVGSVHHREFAEFSAIVTNVKTVGKRTLHSLALIVPDKPALVHVHDVEEGEGPGTLSFPAPAK